MTNFKQTGHLVLTERDRNVLVMLSRFLLLSRDQLMLLATFHSLTRANTRLARFVRSRLVQRKQLPFLPGHGSAQSLYYLGRAAPQVLTLDPKVLTSHLRRISRWELSQTQHVLAANQVLVNFLVCGRNGSNFTVLGFRTEPELRQLFNGQALVPDGWISWTDSGRRFNSFIEVDLHHEGLSAWREKVLAYMAYADSSLHQELFQFRYFRVLVLAKSVKRLENLRSLATVAKRMFLFGLLEEITPVTLLSCVWREAAGEVPIALMAG